MVIAQVVLDTDILSANASKQTMVFNEFCAKNTILPLPDEVVIKAVDKVKFFI